jgi:hypothetical protein
MPDDNRRPDGGGRDPDETVAGAPLDETVAGRPLDETVAGAPDETRAYRPAIDETRAFPADDAPAGADQPTAVVPAAGTPPPVWSGRAGVPPAGVRAPGPATAQWERPPVEDSGRWWMPIVIGLVGLLLLGVLGYGLWLIGAANGDDPEVGSTPTRPATTAPRTTAPPTTPPPTTREPEPEVEVPGGLVGGSLEDAQDRLDEVGLAYRVEFEETDEAEPGTVIRTRPDGGSQVEPGSQVTIVVAVEPEETEPPTPPPSGEESPPGG